MPASVRRDGSRVKILHVEDNSENRMLVRAVLEAEGHTVVDAEDGLAGIEAAIREEPALILLDVNLPAVDGYEVVAILKSFPAFATTPVPPAVLPVGAVVDQNYYPGRDNGLAPADNPAYTNSCGNYYGLRLNPSNTGNIREQAKFTLIPEILTLTLDSAFQYTLANGGGSTTDCESWYILLEPLDPHSH